MFDDEAVARYRATSCGEHPEGANAAEVLVWLALENHVGGDLGVHELDRFDFSMVACLIVEKLLENGAHFPESIGAVENAALMEIERTRDSHRNRALRSLGIDPSSIKATDG